MAPQPMIPPDPGEATRLAGAAREFAADPAAAADSGGHEDETLACGASLAALWEDGGPGRGHGECTYCAQAVREIAALDRTVGAVLREAAEPAVPGDLAARVMEVVRTELRPGPLVPLAAPEAWITEAAAARLFRRAADAESGVVAGSCRITTVGGRTPLRGGRLPREPLRVRLEIAVDLTRPVPEVGAAVRDRVLRAADAQLGLDLAEVDLAIVGVLEDPVPRTRRAGRGRSPA